MVSLEHEFKLYLSLDELMSLLEQPAGGFMTETERISVEVLPGRLLQAGKIIEILRKKGNKEFDIFLKILRESGNEVWASGLEALADKFQQEHANHGKIYSFV